ncbi:unnamed protein product [Lactuca virosa]|uniref:Cytochrome P450 n=1 Tax=Lactuca virosa TaxID=75947 RepID=A0AAU9MQV3_9ASTR|nr:unnamed protein product [Lactuca virosa]
MYLIFRFFLIACLLFLLFVVLIKTLFSTSKPHKNLPPSPRRLPLIGNLHQLGYNPHRTLRAMAQIYGPMMLIRLGTVPVLVASSVDAAREIMKTHDLIFSNRPKLNIPGRLCYGSKDIAFSQYGEYWRQVKSIAVLHLLSNKRVQSYRVALGRTYDGKKFKGLLERFLELLGSFTVGSYIPWLTWVDRLSGLERRADEVAKEFDEFLEGVIEQRLNKKGVGVVTQYLVDILLEIQKDNTTGFRLERDAIKAIIMDVFSAGTDTTFTNLEWAICELLRHPQTMRRLQQEAREVGQGKSMITEDNLDNMPYLKAVLKETLRLHAPVPLLLLRESTQDVKLLGYDITAGTQVIINAWAIARDGSTWEEPDKFRPERFLDSPIDYKGLHFELIPFGAGRRGCPGIQFAMVVNELVFANLVYKFDFSSTDGEDLDMSESIGLTVRKKCPILVVATPRC